MNLEDAHEVHQFILDVHPEVSCPFFLPYRRSLRGQSTARRAIEINSASASEVLPWIKDEE